MISLLSFFYFTLQPGQGVRASLPDKSEGVSSSSEDFHFAISHPGTSKLKHITCEGEVQ